MTKSGWTTFKVAKYRPEANIFVVANDVNLLNAMSLIWGVRGIYYDSMKSTDDTFADIEQILVQGEVSAVRICIYKYCKYAYA